MSAIETDVDVEATIAGAYTFYGGSYSQLYENYTSIDDPNEAYLAVLVAVAHLKDTPHQMSSDIIQLSDAMASQRFR